MQRNEEEESPARLDNWRGEGMLRQDLFVPPVVRCEISNCDSAPHLYQVIGTAHVGGHNNVTQSHTGRQRNCPPSRKRARLRQDQIDTLAHRW